MGSDVLTKKVIERLQHISSQYTSTNGEQNSFASLCTLENTSISGTHTHSAPAGFIQYTLYQITSLGFSKEHFDALVEGIAHSLLRAHEKLRPGSLSVASGHLLEANINRSPTSYLLNPQEERDLYADQGDTDKNMLLLKLTQDPLFNTEKPKDIGILTWFSVHGTSMNATNQLISGDNKGYASYLTEKHFNPPDSLPGSGEFVAAFSSTNLGDVSPNTNGPKCIDTGLPCDIGQSTCDGRNEKCIASGPGKNMFESTKIIGRKQYEHALKLIESLEGSKSENSTSYATDILNGTLSFRHVFVDMSNKKVTLENGNEVRTCPAALGYSFGAGTTDGPGTFDFTQGSNSTNPFWNKLSGYLSKPNQDQIDCQAPKPILLNTGNASKPYDWDPASVPISIFRIGKLFILNVPSEFTTMSGRRLRRAVRSIAVANGIMNPIVTISGLANSYTHYVTTYEEYQGQRYEAASTLYGPHTLSAYIQEFKRITSDLLSCKESDSDYGPPDLLTHQISFLPPVIFDSIERGKTFGSVKNDAETSYVAGESEVFVSFYSANPRNNLKIESTFLKIDLQNLDGSWETKFVDGDWCTKFIWDGNEILGKSIAHITWDIPKNVERGTYRVCHYGTRKRLWKDSLQSKSSAYRWWQISRSFVQLSWSWITRSTTKKMDTINKLDTVLEDFYGCSRSFLVV